MPTWWPLNCVQLLCTTPNALAIPLQIPRTNSCWKYVWVFLQYFNNPLLWSFLNVDSIVTWDEPSLNKWSTTSRLKRPPNKDVTSSTFKRPSSNRDMHAVRHLKSNCFFYWDDEMLLGLQNTCTSWVVQKPGCISPFNWRTLEESVEVSLGIWYTSFQSNNEFLIWYTKLTITHLHPCFVSMVHNILGQQHWAIFLHQEFGK